MKISHLIAVSGTLALAACNQNTAIGNDREAALDPPAAAAPIEPAETALANIATALVKPETMTDADIAALGGTSGRCVFTFTEVGFPAFVYRPGEQGFLKLNGRIIPLSATGADRFVSGGLVVATRFVDETGNAGLQAMEILVVPPQAGDELGYRGYTTCAKP
ncbi:DUF6692 family protein [Aurantiacibacter spongiae]|uniref:DUF6692 domain-containing protein n=1 Tax=Aurantiacibacter spongiae TaxID=2488860 RepID=A0A3N5CWK3_9SPHN|nr:DUF6692 family protein [Aurantiacibacter spongiae]RPF71019.1 hypothetical protein EG799_04880 [Aurantiacibacter spongiae]